MNALTTLLTFTGGQPASPQRSTPTGAEGFESVLQEALPQAAAETAEQGSEPALDLHAKIESLPLEYAPRPAMILQAIATAESAPAAPTVDAEQSDTQPLVPALAPAEAPVDDVPVLPAAGSPVLIGMTEISPSAPTGTIGMPRTEPAPDVAPDVHTTEEAAPATPATRAVAPAPVEGAAAPAPAEALTAPSAEQVEPGKAPAQLSEPLPARPMEPNRLIVPPAAPAQPTARPRSDTAPAAPAASSTATASQPLTVPSAAPAALQEQAPATAHPAPPVTAQAPTAPRPEPAAVPLENPAIRSAAPIPVEPPAVMPTPPQQSTQAPAQVAAPQTPAPAPAPAPAPLNEQLAKPIYSLVRQGPGEHTMTLTVTPDELGPVTVRAHIGSEGTVRVELFAGSDTTRESLRAILVDLRRDLAGQGIGSNLDLSAHDRPQQDSRRAEPDRRWHREPEPEQEQPQAPHRRMYDHGSSLNVMA